MQLGHEIGRATGLKALIDESTRG